MHDLGEFALLRMPEVPGRTMGRVAVMQGAVLPQVAGMPGVAMALKVRRRTDQQQPHPAQPAGQQAGIFQVGNAQRQVKAFGNQVHLGIAELDLQIHVRMLQHEARQQRGQPRDAERHGGCHTHLPAQAGGMVHDFGFHRFTFLQDAGGALQCGLAGIGQRHTPRGAVQQHGLEAALQPGDRFGHRGLRQRQLLRRARE
jgi:hypothetical protein